jgi:hypothetical protein
MSTQYPGGFITKSPVAPTSSAASGIWTVDQALQYVKAGTWPAPPMFIEDLFSTYLYTGTGATQTITNGVDLSGGMVWIKSRGQAQNHSLFNTANGATKLFHSNTTDNLVTDANSLTAFNTTGFTLGSGNTAASQVNTSASTYVSWSFKKQPKFFDIVTYTGTAANLTLSHSLGSVPGFILVKSSSEAGNNWWGYHQSLGNNQTITLNTNAAQDATSTAWNSTTPTSTEFYIGNNGQVNSSTQTYTAFLFASNAGGFSANGGGSTNGITCGSFSFVAGKATINLGYEAQWLLLKRTNSIEQWWIYDNIRGMSSTTLNDMYLGPNTALVESDFSSITQPTATGFYLDWSNNGITNQSYIYVAIRRGPMKTPTVGTSVFSPVVRTGTGADATITAGFPVDMFAYINSNRSADVINGFSDRLRAAGPEMLTSTTTAAGITYTSPFQGGNGLNSMTGVLVTSDTARAWINYSAMPYINYLFRRAPSFFDMVCYTGTGANTTQAHNLNIAPEMMIVKKRDAAADWQVYHSALGPTKLIELNLTGSESTSSTRWNNTAPTASVFTIGTHTTVNASGALYVNYLFATLAGISKVGSFTGTAALQTLNCGFTTGARFVLIKRYDAGSTGDWYVWDSASGITSGNDPYMLLNSAAAQVTGTNYVDTDTTGFKVTAAASTTVNISAATYIFLAIA